MGVDTPISNLFVGLLERIRGVRDSGMPWEQELSQSRLRVYRGSRPPVWHVCKARGRPELNSETRVQCSAHAAKTSAGREAENTRDTHTAPTRHGEGGTNTSRECCKRENAMGQALPTGSATGNDDREPQGRERNPPPQSTKSTAQSPRGQRTVVNLGACQRARSGPLPGSARSTEEIRAQRDPRGRQEEQRAVPPRAPPGRGERDPEAQTQEPSASGRLHSRISVHCVGRRRRWGLARQASSIQRGPRKIKESPGPQSRNAQPKAAPEGGYHDLPGARHEAAQGISERKKGVLPCS